MDNTFNELQNGLFLIKKEKGLCLTDGVLELYADFSKMKRRLKAGNLNTEMLVKAVKLKKHTGLLRVLDATAGLGEDSSILASAGFNVDMYEYDKVIYSLLSDGIERASSDPDLWEMTNRMHLFNEDSISAMRRIAACPENSPYNVIFLDPMFPERQKSSLVKKKFQLLHKLEMPCGNEEELLEAALALHPEKIVIKRPAKGPFLSGRKPDYSLSGKAVRYDCIVNI